MSDTLVAQPNSTAYGSLIFTGNFGRGVNLG